MSSSSRSNGSRRSISSATRPFSARRDAVALQLEAALQQQPVDLVVVDDQQARGAVAALHALRSSGVPRRRARTRCASASERHRRWPRRTGASPRRAPARAPCAPKLQRAERVGVGLERVRGAPERVGVARRRRRRRSSSMQSPAPPARNASTSSATNSAPAVSCSSSNVARSIVRLVHVQSLLARGTWFERLDQPLDADRLGQVVVHAGGEADLAVALHRVGRHRDDARALVRRPAARRCCRAASSPSISGICTSISTTS